MTKVKALLKNTITVTLVQSLKLLRFMPLTAIHAFSVFIGAFNYVFNSDRRAHAKRNLMQSRLVINSLALEKMLFKSALENSKGVFETFAIWFKPQTEILAWVKDVEEWQAVETALSAGKGLIFITPHLGCFEITSLFYGSHQPIAVMYRPPRQSWLSPLINSGRQRGGVSLAPANGHGVKQLLQALKRGEAIGILPDQAPLEGEGEWAPFFERPAYTMTLASKLAQKTGAQVFMAFGERLSFGRGYHIHIRPIRAGGIDTPALLNAEIETTIRQCPTQYLWGYDRYKDRQQNSPANH
jgi:KDO2-lipid IV(A) lauroyltransferase